MRILWLAPVHFKPGQEVHPAPWISTLARALTQAHGVDLTILNYQPRLTQEKITSEQDGVRYVFLKTPVPKLDHLGNFRKRIGIIHKYLLEHRGAYDMIHVHGSEHQYEASVIGTGIPYVLSMQGVMGACLEHLTQRWTYTHLSWWMSSRYEKRGLPRVSEFICRTHFDTSYVRQCNPDAHIHENWEMIRPEFFEDLGTDRPDTILYMGGNHPIKGLDLALRAIDILRQQVDVRMQILGKVEPSDIQALLDKYGLHDLSLAHIDLLGFQDAKGVARAMDRSYLLLHTSRIDNSPNSVCEAQVAGLPVVCTRVGGVPSLIRHGHTGMLCELDPQDIADKAMELIRNPNLHSTLKRESRTMARQRHDPKTISQRTMDIYCKVLDAHANHETNIQGAT